MRITPKCTTISIVFHKPRNQERPTDFLFAHPLFKNVLCCAILQNLPPSAPGSISFHSWDRLNCICQGGQVKERFIHGIFCSPCFALQIGNPRSGKGVYQQERTMPSELDAFPSITPSFHPNPGSFPHHYFSTFSPHNVFPQVTRFDTVIPSKMFAFWAESSHSFWRAWSLQLHLFHPSLEWVGGPQPPCCPLLLCAYSWPDISLPVTSATLFALLVLQFLIL